MSNKLTFIYCDDEDANILGVICKSSGKEIRKFKFTVAELEDEDNWPNVIRKIISQYMITHIYDSELFDDFVTVENWLAEHEDFIA